MNTFGYLRRFAALFVLSAALTATATPIDRDRDVPTAPIGIGDRIIRLIKKIPKPILPRIFDDVPIIPKP